MYAEMKYGKWFKKSTMKLFQTDSSFFLFLFVCLLFSLGGKGVRAKSVSFTTATRDVSLRYSGNSFSFFFLDFWIVVIVSVEISEMEGKCQHWQKKKTKVMNKTGWKPKIEEETDLYNKSIKYGKDGGPRGNCVKFKTIKSTVRSNSHRIHLLWTFELIV